MHHIFFIHSSIDEQVGCFHVLPNVNNVAMNMQMRVSLWDGSFISSGSISRHRIAGSYGSSIFSFLRNLHTVFYHGCTCWHPTSTVQVFPFLHNLANTRYLLFLSFFLFFFNNSRPNRSKVIYCCGSVLICISLMISTVEYLFIYQQMLAICMPIQCLWPFFNWAIVITIESCDFFVYFGS